jgi:hypothetical protein
MPCSQRGGGKTIAVNIHNLGIGQHHAPAASSPEKRRGTLCTGGTVGLGAGMDGCWKYSHRDMNPGPSSPWGIAVPTELPRSPWTDLYAFLKQHAYNTSKRVSSNVGRIQLCLSKSRAVISNILVIKVNGISLNGPALISFLPPAWSLRGSGAQSVSSSVATVTLFRGSQHDCSC